MHNKMKAVIFVCSLHKAKYSNTRAWAEILSKKLKLKNIETQIILLRDYDYESSTDNDDLHTQLKHVYDASLIIFSSPSNLEHPTFYCTNLVDRFVHAYEKSKKKNIDIFKNKIWEYCSLQSQLHYRGGYRSVNTFREWMNHHGFMMEKLKFMEHLGLKDTAVLTSHPKSFLPPHPHDDVGRPIGPNYSNMEKDNEVLRMCDNVIDTFITKITPYRDSPIPDCSLDEFMECFRSDDRYAFGRGMTIADENINAESVEAHIKHINDTINIPNRKGLVFIMMKERCTRLGLMDFAEQYYFEQYKLMRSEEYKSSCSGNYRPNGY